MTLWLGAPSGMSPSNFGGHRHCRSEDITILICHVILQGYAMIKGYATLMVGACQGKLPSCQAWWLQPFG